MSEPTACACCGFDNPVGGLTAVWGGTAGFGQVWWCELCKAARQHPDRNFRMIDVTPLVNFGLNTLRRDVARLAGR